MLVYAGKIFLMRSLRHPPLLRQIFIMIKSSDVIAEYSLFRGQFSTHPVDNSARSGAYHRVCPSSVSLFMSFLQTENIGTSS